jgi:ferredoxin-NADP reductase
MNTPIPVIRARPITAQGLYPKPASAAPISQWSGYRPFLVEQRVRESETISSFYLGPEDGEPLPLFKPGQFVNIRLEIPGRADPLFRTYTLSDKPDPMRYRITVKQEPGTDKHPPGVGSNYFHNSLGPGTRLWVSAPRGKFHLDPLETTPVALISAGVGLTPMISMLTAIVASGSGRPVWFIHGARNGREHAMGDLVHRIGREHANVHVHVLYSRPTVSDRQGRDYDAAGYVDGALLQRLLPHSDLDFYLCGPGRFIDSLRNSLLGSGVDEQRIHSEHFNAALTLADATVSEPIATERRQNQSVQVWFARSRVVACWEPGTASILELAETAGLAPDSACRAGVCQICTQRLVQGEVAHLPEPAQMPEPGFILPCCARPVTDVVVDL